MDKLGRENFAIDLEENDEVTKIPPSEDRLKLGYTSSRNGNFASENEIQESPNNEKEEAFIVTSIRKRIYLISQSLILWNVVVPVFCHTSIFVYVTLAVLHRINSDNKAPLVLYDGLGLFLTIVCLSYMFMFYYEYAKPYLEKRANSRNLDIPGERSGNWFFLFFKKCISKIIYAVPVSIFLYCIGRDAIDDPKRLRSLFALFLILSFGYLFSKHPTRVKWSIVFRGIFLQIVMALCTVRWEAGRIFFENLGDKIEKFLSFSYVGAAFVYSDNLVYNNVVFAFQCLSVIFFVNFLVEALFYLSVLQRLFKKLGWFLQKAMGTTSIESINCCVSVFLGMTEAMLVIKPYLADLTLSELQAVILGELSTVAGSVFAAYTSFGVNPGYLVTASVMSAPAALSLSKLLYPETDKSKTTAESLTIENHHKQKFDSVLSAGCEGALSAVQIVFSIVATLIAFISLVAFADSVVSWLGDLIGYQQITIVFLLGKVFAPVAFLIGVDFTQSNLVGELIATKIMINEFVAYRKLGELKKLNLLSSRSEAIATYALCSFSNPGSVASALAMISAVCPSQLQNATKLAFRAYIGGIVTCFMTASIAGLLISPDGSFHREVTNASLSNLTMLT